MCLRIKLCNYQRPNAYIDLPEPLMGGVQVWDQ
jgi:hypothetical protein